MEIGIQRLRNCYHITGSPEASGQVRVRLDQIAATSLPLMLEATLARSLGNDPAVYVIRRVQQPVWLYSATSPDGWLARRWGQRLAAGVLRVLSRGEEGEDVVSFVDEETFIACFVADLLRGVAWERWYYFPFARFRRATSPQTLAAVLQAHAPQLPLVAARLYHTGSLESTLAALDSETQAALWFPGAEQGPARERAEATARPLFAAAIRLIGRLRFWREEPPGLALVNGYLLSHPAHLDLLDWQDPHSLALTVAAMVAFLAARDYLRAPPGPEWETSPVWEAALAELDWLDRDTLRQALLPLLRAVPPAETTQQPAVAEMQRVFATAVQLASQLGLLTGVPPGPELLAAYLATHPSVVDGYDRRGLAAAVLEALHFLLAQGALRLPLPAALTRPVGESSMPPLLAELTWLDQKALMRDLQELLNPSPPAPATLPPRLRRLLTDLLAAIHAAGASLRLDGWPQESAASRESPANLLRLLALLVDYAPQWAGDELVYPTLRRLLAFWSERPLVPEAAFGDEATPWSALLAALDGLSIAGGTATAGGVITTSRAASTTQTAHEEWASPFLGVALLWRAVLDANLTALVNPLDNEGGRGASSLPELLLALALRWAGATSQSGAIDPALCLLCGWNKTFPTWSNLHASLDTTTFNGQWNGRWLRLLAGQRLLAPQALHLYRLALREEEALVAGDGSGGLWPLAVVLPDSGETAVGATAVAEWWALWQDVVGVSPRLLCDPATEPFLPDGADYSVVAREEPEQEGTMAAVHTAGRRRLLAAIAALEAGQLGQTAVDLPLALLASALLRLWARWLRGFADSSVPYLLDNLVRRRGRLLRGREGWLLELEARPLDMVLEMAGYHAPLEQVGWLDGQRLVFRLAGMQTM